MVEMSFLSKKAKLDGHYTSNITLSLDIKIFFITILTVFKADGVQEGASDQEVASNTKGAIF